ncbi:MAG: NAD-dependent epimerase/dehydratase family protein, partial [Thermoplasmata archaeon]|nr:NAD-dependent epimerase/dehydratase family protein [Thermoplasmata archaeon]
MITLKAFVTGGTGFIGNALVRKLIKSGRDVTCLVRRTSDISKLKAAGAKFIVGDIRNRNSMEDGISDCDVVFHLAAWYEFGIWNKRGMFETNVIGTQNVLSL